mmetsp:Transcript_11388/g.12786  ORF Transcript_11388/g.12786 Transcript_11388/m.12786 type:complete len:237 (+) Transcript_11388:30-740(+)
MGKRFLQVVHLVLHSVKHLKFPLIMAMADNGNETDKPTDIPSEVPNDVPSGEPSEAFAQVGQYSFCDAIELKEDLPSESSDDYYYAGSVFQGNVGRNAVTQQACEDSCASNMNCLSYSWSDSYKHWDNGVYVLCKHYLQTATAKFEDAECWLKPKGTANVDAYKLGDGICYVSGGLKMLWSCSCNSDCGNPEDRADKGFHSWTKYTTVTWFSPGCVLMGTNSPSDRIAVAVCKNKV